MSTLEIKQQLHQFIETSDDNSIMKFYEMFKSYIEQSKKENIVTYTVKGELLTKEQYIAHLNKISKSVQHGAKTNTTKEVKDFIFNS